MRCVRSFVLSCSVRKFSENPSRQHQLHGLALVWLGMASFGLLVILTHVCMLVRCSIHSFGSFRFLGKSQSLALVAAAAFIRFFSAFVAAAVVIVVPFDFFKCISVYNLN